MDILWRVFHILKEPVPYTFVSINRRNNKARADIAMCVWSGGLLYTYTTKYPWIYGYYYSVMGDGRS